MKKQAKFEKVVKSRGAAKLSLPKIIKLCEYSTFN